MNNTAIAGFVYNVEVLDRNGLVTDSEIVHNLFPLEGIHYMLAASLKGGSAYTTWYVSLFTGNYTPVPGDTMATFPASATEATNKYTQASRPALQLGTPSAGSLDNAASPAEFTGNTDGTLITGGFVSSSPTKGGTAGVLMSAVRFTSPKALDAGGTLRITAGFQIVSN